MFGTFNAWLAFYDEWVLLMARCAFDNFLQLVRNFMEQGLTVTLVGIGSRLVANSDQIATNLIDLVQLIFQGDMYAIGLNHAFFIKLVTNFQLP